MGGLFSHENLLTVRFTSNFLKVQGPSARGLRLVFVGDTFGQHRSLACPPGDIFIFTGRWSSEVDAPKGELADFRAWLAELPHACKIMVGNASPGGLRDADQNQMLFPEVKYLQDRLFTNQGLKIYGTPWVQKSPTTSASPYARSPEGLERAWSRIPYDLDILITACAPKDVLDDGRGSVTLLREVLVKKPRLHVFASPVEWHPSSESLAAGFARCFEASGQLKARYLGAQEDERPTGSALLDLDILEQHTTGLCTTQTLLPSLLSAAPGEVPTLFANVSTRANLCLALGV